MATSWRDLTFRSNFDNIVLHRNFYKHTFKLTNNVVREDNVNKYTVCIYCTNMYIVQYVRISRTLHPSPLPPAPMYLKTGGVDIHRIQSTPITHIPHYSPFICVPKSGPAIHPLPTHLPCFTWGERWGGGHILHTSGQDPAGVISITVRLTALKSISA